MKRRCPICKSILRPSERSCETCGIDVPMQSQREVDRLAGEPSNARKSEPKRRAS